MDVNGVLNSWLTFEQSQLLFFQVVFLKSDWSSKLHQQVHYSEKIGFYHGLCLNLKILKLEETRSEEVNQILDRNISIFGFILQYIFNCL